MKAAVFQGIGQIEIVELPVPEPEPGEVVIKVHYCGICGSDLGAYETGTYGAGLIIGHEFAGKSSRLVRGCMVLRWVTWLR